MGNDSSTQAQAPPAEAPPISKSLEDDLANVEQQVQKDEAESSRETNKKRRKNAPGGAHGGPRTAALEGAAVTYSNCKRAKRHPLATCRRRPCDSAVLPPSEVTGKETPWLHSTLVFDGLL